YAHCRALTRWWGGRCYTRSVTTATSPSTTAWNGCAPMPLPDGRSRCRQRGRVHELEHDHLGRQTPEPSRLRVPYRYNDNAHIAQRNGDWGAAHTSATTVRPRQRWSCSTTSETWCWPARTTSCP